MLEYKLLWRYIARSYLRHFGIITFVFTILFFLANTFDALNKFRNAHVPVLTFFTIVLLKIPHLFSEALFVIYLLSIIAFFEHLNRTNELFGIINASISIKRIMLVPTSINILISILIMLIVSPLGSILLNQHDAIETKFSKNKPDPRIINKTMILNEEYQDQIRFLSIKKINLISKELTDLTLVILDKDFNFLTRIESERGVLNNKTIALYNARIYNKDSVSSINLYFLPTLYSINNLSHAATTPENIIFWKLPYIIQKLSQVGLSTREYELCFYKQLFKPIVAICASSLGLCLIGIYAYTSTQIFARIVLILTTYTCLLFASTIFMYKNIHPAIAVVSPPILVILCSRIFLLRKHGIMAI